MFYLLHKLQNFLQLSCAHWAYCGLVHVSFWYRAQLASWSTHGPDVVGVTPVKEAY